MLIFAQKIQMRHFKWLSNTMTCMGGNWLVSSIITRPLFCQHKSPGLPGLDHHVLCPCGRQNAVHYIFFFFRFCRIGYLSGARQQFLYAWSVFQEETSFSGDDSRLQFWSGFAINQSVRLESNQVRQDLCSSIAKASSNPFSFSYPWANPSH